MHKIKCVYQSGETPIMADIVFMGVTKRIQRAVFDEIVKQGEADLSEASYEGFDSLTIPINTLEDYVGRMLRAERYTSEIGVIDLRGIPYHGGTTLSSGVLPKWDIGGVFIKCCSVSSTGNWQADSLHESYIPDLFAGTSAKIASAVPAYAVFIDAETRRETVRLCEVAIKFSGKVTYFRDLRQTCDYGRVNDELIDFADDFPSARQGLVNMFVVDYVTNQEDRHSKNFGVLSDGSLAPLYDNGASFHYAEPDERLYLAVDDIAQTKFLRKDPLVALRNCVEWLGIKSDIDLSVIIGNLDVVEAKHRGLMSKERLSHNRTVAERRIAKCAEFTN